MSLERSQLDNSVPNGIIPVPKSCAIVLAEAKSVTPFPVGEAERMARRRFQSPTPRREGKFWWLFFRQDDFVDGKHIRKFKRAKLAPASMPDREVKKIAAE